MSEHVDDDDDATITGDFATLLAREALREEARAATAEPAAEPEATVAAEPAVPAAMLRALAEALPRFGTFGGNSPWRVVEALVGEIDRALAAQINLILHHPEFQQIEASWRGLRFMLNGAGSDPGLKMRVLDIGKRELARTLKQVSRHRLGPEPAVQAHLRGGVRPVRRRALWRADRRLRLRPPARGRAVARRHRA